MLEKPQGFIYFYVMPNGSFIKIYHNANCITSIKKTYTNEKICTAIQKKYYCMNVMRYTSKDMYTVKSVQIFIA